MGEPLIGEFELYHGAVRLDGRGERFEARGGNVIRLGVDRGEGGVGLERLRQLHGGLILHQRVDEAQGGHRSVGGEGCKHGAPLRLSGGSPQRVAVRRVGLAALGVVRRIGC